MTPEERYRQFVQDYPHLLDDLTQKDGWPGIGITPGRAEPDCQPREGQPTQGRATDGLWHRTESTRALAVFPSGAPVCTGGAIAPGLTR